jgi:hypothetical protein
MNDASILLYEDVVKEVAQELCAAGFHDDLLFQSKENRDAVWAEGKRLGGKFRRGSTGHQLLDPRYTVEGRHIPNQGMGNDYRHSFANLYTLTRTL